MIHEQAGKEIHSPRRGTTTNSSSNSQETPATRGGHSACTAVLSEFSVPPTNPAHPEFQNQYLPYLFINTLETNQSYYST
jgi:hypothetical protein